ncbi:SNF2 family N-terminal domain-containing protein [Dipodascopsis uninucleata]
MNNDISLESNRRPTKKRRFFVDDESKFLGATNIKISTSEETRSSANDKENIYSNSEAEDKDNLLNIHATEPPLLSPQHATVQESSIISYQENDHDLDERATTITTDQENLKSSPVIDNKNGEGSLLNFENSHLEVIIGETISKKDFEVLYEMSEGDIERAINYYYDGTFQRHLKSTAKKLVGNSSSSSDNNNKSSSVSENGWQERFIGSFQVEAWATRSSKNLLRYGDKIRIKRVVRQTGIFKRGGSSNASNTSSNSVTGSSGANDQDVFIRFTNEKGDEIGRLPTSHAEFVSVLLDLNICNFTGTVIFVDETITIGDNIYLQIDCFFRRTAFDSDVLVDSSSSAVLGSGSFFTKDRETDHERRLRLRQKALLKLFANISLEPFQANDLVKKHRDNNFLQTDAIIEQYEANASEHAASKSDDNSSDEAEASDTGNLEQDQLDELYRKAQTYDMSMKEVEPGDTFAMDLRPYQKQGLGWMLSRESVEDSVADRRQDSMHPLWEEYKWPVQEGITKKIPNDATANSDKSFYLNPYNGELSLDFPRLQLNALGGILADEMGLGKTISTLALVHSSNNNNAGINKPENIGVRVAASTTLVVAPMSLLAQWEYETRAASRPGTVQIIVYYGDDKTMDLVQLCCGSENAKRPVIVITSYGTILSEWRKHARNLPTKLFKLHFLRVVLDEAHTIRNRLSKISRACTAINADRRWALTGTPIVNKLDDLFSLVRYLGLEPWSNFSFWKSFITTPFESKDYLKALDVVQTVLEPIVLRRTKTMKQKDGQPLITLPPKKVIIEDIQLSETERQVYDIFYRRAKQTFNASIEAGTVLKSYTTILAQILRLRQACCHPTLVKSAVSTDEVENDPDVGTVSKDEISSSSLILDNDDIDLKKLLDNFNETERAESAKDTYGVEVVQQILKETERECPICSAEPIVDQVVTGCWHMSCRDCLLEHIKFQRDHGQQPRCHSCRMDVCEKKIYEVVHERESEQVFLRLYKPHSSAKVSRLLEKLHSIRKEEPSAKSIVFSQFTAFLDEIENSLKRDKFRYLRFDGSMPQRERATVLKQFEQADYPAVLLISLKAGGVGLNLVSANKVFMMDPWWSFAVESQAIDRVYRMGQTQSVTIYRFIVKGSVEERMLKIQDRKKFLASSLGMSEDQKRTQRIDDIKLLFD